MKAPEILERGAQHMRDRAAMRDQPDGARSMLRTVNAFNALTGHSLSERDGWLFMVALKAARACATPTGVPDDYEDGAAYFGLAGECAAARSADFTTEDTATVQTEQVKIAEPRLALATIGATVFTVPDGYNFVAQDAGGDVYAYVYRPSVRDGSGHWESNRGELAKLGYATSNLDWRNSLISLSPSV